MLRRYSINVTTYFIVRRASSESRNSNGNLLGFSALAAFARLWPMSVIVLARPYRTLSASPRAETTLGAFQCHCKEKSAATVTGREPGEKRRLMSRQPQSTGKLSFQNRSWLPSKSASQPWLHLTDSSPYLQAASLESSLSRQPNT